MRLTVISSGSAGNCYVLEGRRSSLVLECGVRPERVAQELPKLRWQEIAGALVTHEHGDHASYAGRWAGLGVDVLASEGTLKAMGLYGERRTKTLRAMQPVWVGEFVVSPFMVHHDAAEPMGFVVDHPEMGKLLFVTDTQYVDLTFRALELDHIMVEANYDDRILEEKVGRGEMGIGQAQRVKRTHMSIGAACDLLRANETGSLKTAVLVHLSGRNGNASDFAARAERSLLFAKVHVAKAGLSIELKKEEL